MGERRISQTQELLRFIKESPTAFHAVESIEKRLSEHRFERLEEGMAWKLCPGKGYYVTRNGSSIVAFRIPNEKPKQMLLTASHSDSPMFKLKSNYELTAFEQYLKLDTEVYGGTILSSWLDRPLSVAGRVILHRNGCFEAKNVCLDRDLLLIPSVAIHMNRQCNDGIKWDPAVDTVPLFGKADQKGVLERLLAEAVDASPDEIADADLFVYNRMHGSIWGADDAFFSAPRIDNLMCAFGTLLGFCEGVPAKDSLNVYFCADNEETGSSTKQGAGSVFLSDVLDRICEGFGTDKRRLLASSFMVSADNAHARHPNHPELSDPINAPNLNGGVVIKTNAAQHYATDGLSSAVFREICRCANVPVQYFANRSDLRGGSTLGSISNTLVPVATVDIGMAQLAMHSSYETAGTDDLCFLYDAMRQFYSVTVRSAGDGKITLETPKVPDKTERT